MSETMTNQFCEFSKFHYWFSRKTPDTFDVIDLSDGMYLFSIKDVSDCNEDVGENKVNSPMLTLVENEAAEIFFKEAGGKGVVDKVYGDFCLYKHRPEYVVGRKWVEDDSNAASFYERCILGLALIRARERRANPDEVIPKAQKILDWIASTDFYICPASTQYHDSYECGLLHHTLKVMNKAIDLLYAEPFKSAVTNISSVVLTALVHDWCKIGLYKSYMRNVKDEETGQWNQVKAYKYEEDRAICLGHGVSSLYLAMKFFNLSMEECCAIRYHMGRWNTVDSEVNELQQANRTYPLVHLIQFADQLAITRY